MCDYDINDACIINNWLVSSILLLLLIVSLAFIFNKKRLKLWVFSNIKWLAGLILTVGFILYFVGYNKSGSGSENNAVALFLRASLSSIEMFATHSDLKLIDESLQGNGWYMTIFAITHFFAVLISAIFIVRMFGFRLLSWFKLQMWRWWGVKELHVFFGVNENSMLVAKNICEQNDNQNKTETEGKKIKKTARIIFVNTPSDTQGIPFSFSRFFLSSNDDVEKYYAEIEDIDALMTNANRSFKNCIIEDKNNKAVFQLLGIPSCGNLIEKTLACGKQVKLYFLSDVEDDNKYAIMRLKEHQIMDCENLKCYCHARNNAVNRQLLVSDKKMVGRLHIVDTSTLTIQELKKNEMHHPVNYVNINKDATVDEFAGMVIGFGEIGRDAFRFLWEYASFVKSVENGNIVETPKTFYLVDKDLSRHQADFMIGTPALEDVQSIAALESNATINWCEMSTHSIAFNRLLRKVIDRLNYVIIAVGDDDEAISIMQKVWQVASQYRQNPLKLGLYVSVRNKEKKEIIEIIYKGTDSNVIIHTIGIKQDIFKTNLLDNEDIEKKAKVFYYHYKLLENRDVVNDIKDDEIKYLKAVVDLWNKRRTNNKNDIINLEYQEEQDRSNAYHIYTKRTLAGFPCTRNRLDCLADEKLIEVLSYCEHLRWNAKMILMGFVYRETKNVSKREHDCLLSCNKLKNGTKDDTIKYDAATANLSFDEELKPIK